MFFPGVFQEGHDSRVQQIDQAGLWGVLLGSTVYYGVQTGVLQMVCLSCNALRYMIKHVDGYLPPVDWKPSKLMKKIIIPIDPRAQITCVFHYRFEWCVLMRKQNSGRVPAFS